MNTIMTAPRITTQRAMRRAFWLSHPHHAALRRAGEQNSQRADIRADWCNFVDSLCRAGIISDALANRATL